MKIVKEDRNTTIMLRAVAEKYNTNISVISDWVNKYEKYGIMGLESQTGKKKVGTKGQGARKIKNCEKELERKQDVELIKEIHEKHPSHGYRWINVQFILITMD